MQDIYQLDWKGPMPAGRDEIGTLPDKKGIYLFANSSSPFVAQVHEFCTRSGDPSLSKPRFIYLGMTTNSLKKRLRELAIAQALSTKTEISDLYLYWLEIDEPQELERKLISHLKPILNRTTFQGNTGVETGTGYINVVSAGIAALETLIERKETSESAYQEMFVKYPFLLGGIFTHVQHHKALDNKNIPDFTGVRSKDGFLDVIEIKQPFLQLVSEDGGMRSEFNNAWNQAERYLDFTRMESDYLRRQKNLTFENPYCYLVAGYMPCESLRKEMSRKQRLNPGIIILTYDQILNTAKSYQHFIDELSEL